MNTSTIRKTLTLVPILAGLALHVVMASLHPKISTNMRTLVFVICWSSVPYFIMSLVTFTTKRPLPVLLAMIAAIVFDIKMWISGFPLFPRAYLITPGVSLFIFGAFWVVIFGAFQILYPRKPTSWA